MLLQKRSWCFTAEHYLNWQCIVLHSWSLTALATTKVSVVRQPNTDHKASSETYPLPSPSGAVTTYLLLARIILLQQHLEYISFSNSRNMWRWLRFCCRRWMSSKKERELGQRHMFVSTAFCTNSLTADRNIPSQGAPDFFSLWFPARRDDSGVKLRLQAHGSLQLFCDIRVREDIRKQHTEHTARQLRSSFKCGGWSNRGMTQHQDRKNLR